MSPCAIRMRGHTLAAIATGVLVGLTCGTARAFCRTTTVPVPPTFQPSGDGCFTQGNELYYASQCVPYHVQNRDGAIPRAVLSDTLAQAFAAWTAPRAPCSPGIRVLEL